MGKKGVFLALLYNQFNKGVNAAKTARDIKDFFDQDVANPRTARWRFEMFCEMRRQIKNKMGAGRPQ